MARLTFDSSGLLSGVEIIVVLIGLFCIPQVLEMAESGSSGQNLALFKPVKGVSTRTALQVVRRWGNLIRSSIIGVIVGIIPGAGGNVAGLLSYQEAMRASKNPQEFGHGAIDGVIASETANNAEVEGSLIPLLTLGIPGAPQAAVLFGALLLQGMRPGPQLFSGRGAEITYTFILSLFLANLIMFVLGFFGSRFYARALNLPKYLLVPVVLGLSVVGSFASRNSSFDVNLMLFLGVLAYFGKKASIPPAPVALGAILGPIIEQGLVESMMLSQGHRFAGPTVLHPSDFNHFDSANRVLRRMALLPPVQGLAPQESPIERNTQSPPAYKKDCRCTAPPDSQFLFDGFGRHSRGGGLNRSAQR